MIAALKPRELKIEITDSCNLQCAFCYHGEDACHGKQFMPEEKVRLWIDWAVENAIPAVRFTGGEPTLHPSLRQFCDYAKQRGRYVILNTNGMADDKLYRELFPLLNDVRISLPTLDAGRMDEITGGNGVLARKLSIIETAVACGVQHVVPLTILLPEHHGTLEQFARFAASMPRLLWLPLRYESTPDQPRPWTRADAQAFAEEMADLMHRYPDHANGIFLAMPFCGVTPVSLGAKVFRGRTLCCGPFASLSVKASGTLQACSDIGEMEGWRSIGEIKNCPETRACASLEILTDECRSCPYVAACGGGCRKPYGLAQHGDKWIDYLAGFVKE